MGIVDEKIIFLIWDHTSEVSSNAKVMEITCNLKISIACVIQNLDSDNQFTVWRNQSQLTIFRLTLSEKTFVSKH